MAVTKTKKQEEAGLQLNKNGTAVLFSDGKRFDLRQPKTRECTEIMDLIEQADQEYLDECDPPEEHAEYQKLRAQAEALSQNEDSGTAAERVERATDRVELQAKLEEALNARSKRIQRTYRPDSPHMRVWQHIIKTLGPNDVEFDPDEAEPYLTQPGSLGDFFVNYQLPLRRGATENGSPNRAERRVAEKTT